MTILGIWVRGLAMGVADAVPGVSGGTVAFLTGIYGRWLAVLTAVRPSLWGVLRREGVKGLWTHLDGSFVLPLLVGIVMSVVTLAHWIEHWLTLYPERVWGFFFGLVLAMGLHLVADLRAALTSRHGLYFVFGAVLAIVIGLQTPTATTPALWIWPFAGAMALSAMLLPGISGSFLLLLTGLYPALIAAVTGGDFLVLGLFLCGGALGILSMAHLLKWLLSRFESQVMCVLTGVVFGALIRVWPWQAEGGGFEMLRLPADDTFWLPFGLACIGFGGGWLALWVGGQNEMKEAG